MLPKDLAPFAYIYPTKNPMLIVNMNYRLLVAGDFRAEYSYISKRVVQLLGSAKNCRTHKPCYAPLRKIPFINAVMPFYGCHRSALKILQLLCRLGLVLQLGSV